MIFSFSYFKTFTQSHRNKNFNKSNFWKNRNSNLGLLNEHYKINKNNQNKQTVTKKLFKKYVVIGQK